MKISGCFEASPRSSYAMLTPLMLILFIVTTSIIGHLKAVIIFSYSFPVRDGAQEFQAHVRCPLTQRQLRPLRHTIVALLEGSCCDKDKFFDILISFNFYFQTFLTKFKIPVFQPKVLKPKSSLNLRDNSFRAG